MASNLVQLTALMGIPGSGKSTLAAALPNLVLVSPDNNRKLLTGRKEDQSRNDEAFALAYQQLHDALTEGKDVVWDATNIHADARAGILRAASTYNAETRLIVIRTPFEECKARNAERLVGRVPDHVMDRMHAGFIRSLSEIGYEKWHQIVNVWEY